MKRETGSNPVDGNRSTFGDGGYVVLHPRPSLAAQQVSRKPIKIVAPRGLRRLGDILLGPWAFFIWFVNEPWGWQEFTALAAIIFVAATLYAADHPEEIQRTLEQYWRKW